MSAFAHAAQEAVYARLTSGLLSSLVGDRVFDDAPQSVGFPWIEIGDRQSIADDTSSANGGSDDGVSDFFDLHVWSRYNGKKEVNAIFDRLHAMFHGQVLAISGRTSALAWIRGARVLRDPDGITRHGIVSIEIIHRT